MSPPRPEFLPDSAYQAHTLPELVHCCELAYGQAFATNNSIRDLLFFASERRYYEVLTNPELHSFLRQDAEDLHFSLKTRFPMVEFNFKGRIKPWISYHNKVIHYLDHNKALDDLNDLIAYRIIIGSEYFNAGQLAQKCYEVLREVIVYYILKGYQLCYADPLSDVLAEDSPLRKHLIIPKGEFIPAEWINSVKNYIQKPKASGYRSLHIVLRHPSTGTTMEIQIRSDEMHRIAEEGYFTEIPLVSVKSNDSSCTDDFLDGYTNGEAYDDAYDDAIELLVNHSPVKHRDYKEHKYPNPCSYNPNQIHLNGFTITKNGITITYGADSGFDTPLYLFEF